MPGVRSASPAASGLPELPRIRTTLPAAASSNVGRAKARGNANTKSKAEEDQEKRRKSGKAESGASASSAARSRSSPPVAGPALDKRRCSWITANSEPLYVAFHDEEWGAPVHDDRKLFELLTLSQALAELTWPVILSKREEFSAMIDGLYNASLCEFTDKKMNWLSKSSGSTLLSGQKMRAAVTNAKQIRQDAWFIPSTPLHHCWKSSFYCRHIIGREVRIRTGRQRFHALGGIEAIASNRDNAIVAIVRFYHPITLSKREEFSAMIDGLYNASLCEFTDKKMNWLSKSSGSTLLSGQKMRAAVTNAKQIRQVVQEFGSFSHYCWSFVNHRPVTNGFRYARQVPSKTPKSEAMSKDMVRRGFRCVGPTTIYSFMQVAGIVNDHLPCCFRFDQACIQAKAHEKDLRAERRLTSRSSEDSDIREV